MTNLNASGPTRYANDYRERKFRERLQKNSFESASWDGWLPVPGKFTYYSAGQVTTSYDLRNKIYIGTKIKLTQGTTVKYFVVSLITATRIDFIVSTDYTVANSPILDFNISQWDYPLSFPSEFKYNCSWIGAGGNPSLGDGTLNAYWWTAGPRLNISVYLKWGSTTTGGSGIWSFNFPWATGYASFSVFGAYCRDAGTATYYLGVAYLGSTTTGSASVLFANDNGTLTANFVSPTHPFTWANGDELNFSCSMDLTNT